MKPEVRYHRFVRCFDENSRYLGQPVMRLLLAVLFFGSAHAERYETILLPAYPATAQEPEPDAAELERLYRECQSNHAGFRRGDGKVGDDRQ